MQSFIMNSHEVFIHIHQGCFAGTGAIVRLPQCQCSKPDGYGKISQCITTTKHSKAKTVCIFRRIYRNSYMNNYFKDFYFKIIYIIHMHVVYVQSRWRERLGALCIFITICKELIIILDWKNPILIRIQINKKILFAKEVACLLRHLWQSIFHKIHT